MLDLSDRSSSVELYCILTGGVFTPWAKLVCGEYKDSYHASSKYDVFPFLSHHHTAMLLFILK